MISLVHIVAAWLKHNSPSSHPEPAPNGALAVLVGENQYDFASVSNVNEVEAACASIPRRPLFPPAIRRHAVFIADSLATGDPLQGAVAVNYTGVESAHLVYQDKKKLVRIRTWPVNEPDEGVGHQSAG
jgi:hypothetical protein